MILDGLKLATKLQNKIQEQLQNTSYPRRPCLVAILTTEDPASHTYVSRKIKACQQVGIESRVIRMLPKTTKELLDVIDQLNQDEKVDGILVQLPLPPNFQLIEVLERISPEKDVDGFHPINVGKVMIGDPNAFYPCTPMGIKMLLEEYKIDVASKRVVVVGRSNIVGKPMAAILMQNRPGCNATVTIAHSKTPDLGSVTRDADILIVAVGKAGCINASMVKKGAVVVDVGMNRLADETAPKGSRLVGDVDVEGVREVASLITPVPGGVGPMTIAMLLQNTFKSFLKRIGRE